MAFGRSPVPPLPARPPGELSAAARLAALEARVDQLRTFFREKAMEHRENKLLVNVLLDADNLLRGPYPENVEGAG